MRTNFGIALIALKSNFSKLNWSMSRQILAIHVRPILLLLVLTTAFICVAYILKGKSVAYETGKATKNVDDIELLTKGSSTGCSSGYLPNYPSICGNDGCLRILSKPRTVKDVIPMDRGHIDQLKSFSGWMSVLHIDVIYHLTRAQREFGLYGSVGEIGVFAGRFTSVLSYWMDAEAGERLFVCDIFGKGTKTGKKSDNASSHIFEKNMNKFGYSLSSADESTRIRSWTESSLFLSKFHFIEMELPAFRLFSIDGNHESPFPLLDLLLVSCVVIDGAIIVIDDYLNAACPDVKKLVGQYLHWFGDTHFLPLLFIHNKLYMVSKRWHGRYMEWFEKNDIPKLLKVRRQSGLGFTTDFYHF